MSNAVMRMMRTVQYNARLPNRGCCNMESVL